MGEIAAGIGHDANTRIAGDGRVILREEPVGSARLLRHDEGIMDTQMRCQQRRVGRRQRGGERQQQGGEPATHQLASLLP